MKKVFWILVCTVFMVAIFAGNSAAFKGRNEGMGNVSGLVRDNSDMLIHPSTIVDGEGLEFFAHYGFTYTDVGKWDFDSEISGGLIPNIVAIFGLDLDGGYDRELDGDEYLHEALLGSAIPLGKGRLGIFLDYTRKRGEFEGKESIGGELSPLGSASINFDEEIDSKLDDFTLSMIFGIPLGAVNLGLELAVGYTNESSSWEAELDDIDISPPVPFLPSIDLVMSDFPILNLLEREILPYDSQYWDFGFKLGVSSEFENGISFALTPKFKWIFGGDNELNPDFNAEIAIAPGIELDHTPNLDGDVDGFDWGLDLWLRFPISDSAWMPFLFRIENKKIERTANGHDDFDIEATGLGTLSTDFEWDVDIEETQLHIEAGGGFDINVTPDTKIAIGVYYNYFDREREYDRVLGISTAGTDVSFDSEFADYEEHQIKIKLAGETAVSPSFALRGGINWFYGSITETYDTEIDLSIPIPIPIPSPLVENTIELDGSRWGISGAIGATIKLSSVTIEPYIKGGYQEIDLSGEEDWDIIGLNILAMDADRTREEWFVGAGFSILFDL
jgi:hypothetical protein